MLKQEDVTKLLEDNPQYVEILQRAVEAEDQLQEEAFLFNWDDLLTDSDEQLKDFLYQQFYRDWIKEAVITKTNETSVSVQDKLSEHKIVITLESDSTGKFLAIATTTEHDNRTYQFDVMYEKYKLELYRSGRVMWEWHDVQASPASIRKMVIAGIIKVAYKTNKRTEYALVDRDIVKAALEQIKYNQDVAEFEAHQPTTQDQTPLEIPEDIFDVIVGYDDIKSIIQKGLGNNKPVNIMFIGTPGTAKSMFLEEINRIPGSSYHLGSSSTKAGLTEFLFNQEPRIVLIDEFEKMDRKDFAVLLSLMEGGKVVETKKGRRREITINASVIASCNSIKNIPLENLSRFHFKFKFIPYTEIEFEEIVQRILTTREQVVPALARYIATATSKITKDVREAVGISRVCDSHEDVDNIMKTREKYQG